MQNQNGWAAPQQQQPQQQVPFAEGIRLFDKHPNAPDFVLASLVISLEDFFNFCQKNPQFLADYQGKKQLKMQILRSQKGGIYCSIDTYGTAAQPPKQQPQQTAQQSGGRGATQQQPAQSGWGQPAQQQPAQSGWGAPAQQPAQPAPVGDLPF